MSESVFPLSLAQERLWIVHQLELGSPMLNLAWTRRIEGSLNARVLAQSFEFMRQRHAILRTRIAIRNQAPVQVLVPDSRQSMSIVDALAQGKDGTAEAIRLAFSMARRPFDLTREEPLRVMLIRLAARDHLLALVMHHIATDGWSMGVFSRELLITYRAMAEGRTPPLAPAPQYFSFAARQRERLRGSELGRQIAYWKTQLDGWPVLNLPSNNYREAGHRGSAVRHTTSVRRRSADALEAIARANGATLFMTLLAAFEILLARHTGQIDFVVGSPAANRARSEFENVIGFFVNLLPLRADLSGNPTFTELLERVKKTCLDAYANQEVPFERIVEELRLDRTALHRPVEAVFALQNAPMPDASLPGLRIRSVGVTHPQIEFKVMVTAWKAAGEIALQFGFDSSGVDRLTIGAMAERFLVLLDAIAADPNRRISELPWTTPAEQARAGARPRLRTYSSSMCIHELFEAQALRRPDAAALVHNGQQLSYAELDRRAGAIARRLRQLGVGPDVCAAVRMERSLEMVVALLAILKAGGAYVPIDPATPDERLAFLVEDPRARVLIVDRPVNVETSARVLHFAESSDPPGPDISGGATPGNLAYIIYTSGSTGKPKGVQVTHANVTSLLASTSEMFDFNENDAWTVFHSYAFDFSVWEIWQPLACGARVVVTPYWVSRSPEAFRDLLERERITVLNQTPAAFRQLMKAMTGSTNQQYVV